MINTLEELLIDYASYSLNIEIIDESTRKKLEEKAKNYIKQLIELNLLNISDVSQQRELLIAAFERLDRTTLTMIEVGDYEKAVDEILSY